MKFETTLTSNLPELGDLMMAQALEVATIGAEATAASARGRILEQVGSGAKYPGLPNRSSAPGQSPVNQLGELADSIGTNAEEIAAGEIGMDAVAGTPYAKYLELGTNRMEPRPFMTPASYVGEEATIQAVAAIPGKIAAELG